MRLPNVRGSSGYGRAFEDLNNRDWGHGDLQDVISGIEYWQTISQHAGTTITPPVIEELIDFDNYSWMQFDTVMWEWIEQLRAAGKRVGLISNMPRDLGEALKSLTQKLSNFDQVTLSYEIHAVKPEPHNDIPTGASAHDTLWDFVSLQPETLHAIMWLMSDRAIPRSYRMMQGFGVHTFRFVNAQGRGTFVKFHWKPKLGVHSLVWDEAQECQGRDPDFNRRDLWDAIEAGEYPEWELGVQLVSEEDEFAFDFDLLDATKIIPEEQVPVRPSAPIVRAGGRAVKL